MEHLIVNVLGKNQPGIADKLTEIAANSGCSIVDSKMNVFGQEFVAILHFSGSWSVIAKAETLLDGFERQTEHRILRQRTKLISYPKIYLPYLVYVTAREEIGLVHCITHFFAVENIEITELYAETRPARKTGMQIISISMAINIPENENLTDLRERFALFCDHYNIDGILEAEKGI